jgi:hypothetical protein
MDPIVCAIGNPRAIVAMRAWRANQPNGLEALDRSAGCGLNSALPGGRKLAAESVLQPPAALQVLALAGVARVRFTKYGQRKAGRAEAKIPSAVRRSTW